MKRQKKFIATATAVLLVTVALMGNTVLAQTVEKTGIDAPSVSSTNFTPQRAVASNYVQATNTFSDGGAKYYLLTQDSNKSNTSSVDFKGTTYPIESVQVVTSATDLSTLNFLNANGSAAGKLFNSAGTNATVFIDDGSYVFSLYTGLSGKNNSYVGLKDVDVSAGQESGVILKKTNVSGSKERILLTGRDTYIENITFDGESTNMTTTANRGEAFIFVNGSNSNDSMNLVMRDIIVQNVGASNSPAFSSPKNKAIELFGVPGQSNFENIKLKNIKTTAGLSPLHIEETDNANFKNINIDMNAASAQAYTIKVETGSHHASTTVKGQLASASDQTVIFAGKIDYSSRNNPLDGIYVERYQYDKVEVPTDFNYAVWATMNGNTNRPSFIITKNYPTADAATGQTKFNGVTGPDLVLHDLKDDYWIIDYGSFSASQSSADKKRYIEEELAQILKVMAYTQKNILIPAEGNDPINSETTVGTNKADVPRAPRANIKLVGSEIPGFTVPDGYADYDTNIVAVDNKDDMYTSRDLVPFEDFDNGRTDLTTVSAVNLPTPNGKTVKLYNFDFHEKANYTLNESTKGISAVNPLEDPLEEAKVADDNTTLLEQANRYGTYYTEKQARVKNSSYDTFANCNFTTLARELKIIDKPADNKISVEVTHTLGKDFRTGYTFNNNTEPNRPVTEIDDTQYIWVSGDPSIATISANGTITPVKKGEVTFYLKSTDRHNQGEIERPFDSVRLMIMANTTWKDTEGNVFKREEGTKEAGTISGYTFVETKVAENGNVVHIFKKNVTPEKPNPINPNKGPGAPSTGDLANPLVYLMIISIAGASLLILTKRRKKRK